MRNAALALAAAIALAAAPALAQAGGNQQTQPGTSQSGTSQPGMNKSGAKLRQTLRQDLAKAGFTDINIMPEAFAVHAKNSAGDPVFMVISPDSMTELTAVPNKPGNQAGAQGNAQRNGMTRE